VGENCDSTLQPVPLFDIFLHGSAPQDCERINVVRYLIWQVGPFQIDIRVESTNVSDSYKVAGLVVHTRTESEPQSDITISLFSDCQELARTRTDLRGEFSIEHSHAGNLQVRLAFSDDIYASVDIGEGIYRDHR
jgi:hypothetical protein